MTNSEIIELLKDIQSKLTNNEIIELLKDIQSKVTNNEMIELLKTIPSILWFIFVLVLFILFY